MPPRGTGNPEALGEGSRAKVVRDAKSKSGFLDRRGRTQDSREVSNSNSSALLPRAIASTGSSDPTNSRLQHHPNGALCSSGNCGTTPSCICLPAAQVLEASSAIYEFIEIIPDAFYFVIAKGGPAFAPKPPELLEHASTYKWAKCPVGRDAVMPGKPAALSELPNCDGVLLPNFKYFCVEKALVYQPFYKDFGPLNLSCLTEYVVFVKKKLLLFEDRLREALNEVSAEASPDGRSEFVQKNKTRDILVHYTTPNPQVLTNAAFLVTAYMMLVENLSPLQAYEFIRPLERRLCSYRDASLGPCMFQLNVLDCLQGLHRGVRLGWYDYTNFDCDEYCRLSDWKSGDMNWIIPNKFIAFAGPVDCCPPSQNYCISPVACLAVFRRLFVSRVIRLNEPEYNESIFTSAGIKHDTLFFPDGSCPPLHIQKKFLAITEAETGPVAVHCKAGLGRTGTLLGCYAIKHFGFNAPEWIAWNRLCRPGSILGPQHFFLENYHKQLTLHSEPSLSFQDQDADTVASLLAAIDIDPDQNQEVIRTFQDPGQGSRLLKHKYSPTSLLRKADHLFSLKAASLAVAANEEQSEAVACAQGPDPQTLVARSRH